MDSRIRTRERFSEQDLTAKQAITILHKRCAIMTATRGRETNPEEFTERGEIRVNPIGRFGERGY